MLWQLRSPYSGKEHAICQQGDVLGSEAVCSNSPAVRGSNWPQQWKWWRKAASFGLKLIQGCLGMFHCCQRFPISWLVVPLTSQGIDDDGPCAFPSAGIMMPLRQGMLL